MTLSLMLAKTVKPQIISVALLSWVGYRLFFLSFHPQQLNICNDGMRSFFWWKP